MYNISYVRRHNYVNCGHQLRAKIIIYAASVYIVCYIKFFH